MFRKKDDPERQTKDSSVLFFQNPDALKLVKGEQNIVILSRVEDSKGHPGQFGQGQITNIRFFWYIQKKPTLNCSIGYNTILSHKISTSGNYETLLLRCKEEGKSYEFLFSMLKSSSSAFKIFEIALKNYQDSIFFRQQVLRSAIIKNGTLKLLPGEQAMLTMDGLSNFCGDSAKIGTSILTNLRFIWYSEVVSNFNVSIPHIILPKFKVTDSKRFGKSFFINLFISGTQFLYGFTISPEEKLVEFVESAEKIRLSAIQKPVLTPPLVLDITQQPKKEVNPVVEEDFAVEEIDPSLRYIPCDDTNTPSQNIVYDANLGLSIEELPKDVSLSKRWAEVGATPLSTVDHL